MGGGVIFVVSGARRVTIRNEVMYLGRCNVVFFMKIREIKVFGSLDLSKFFTFLSA